MKSWGQHSGPATVPDDMLQQVGQELPGTISFVFTCQVQNLVLACRHTSIVPAMVKCMEICSFGLPYLLPFMCAAGGVHPENERAMSGFWPQNCSPTVGKELSLFHLTHRSLGSLWKRRLLLLPLQHQSRSPLAVAPWHCSGSAGKRLPASAPATAKLHPGTLSSRRAFRHSPITATASWIEYRRETAVGCM